MRGVHDVADQAQGSGQLPDALVAVSSPLTRRRPERCETGR